eukprot:5892101-Pyramimonas_sp.AAC.1
MPGVALAARASASFSGVAWPSSPPSGPDEFPCPDAFEFWKNHDGRFFIIFGLWGSSLGLGTQNDSGRETGPGERVGASI